MVRGPRKHMKRVAAPKHWMLDKLGGCYAPRPSSGPHKLRECLPLALFLRNRLKYALNYTEVKKILAQRLVKVDGRVRTDHTYPSGFMDVIEMEKSGENFRLIYDVKGRYKVGWLLDLFSDVHFSRSVTQCESIPKGNSICVTAPAHSYATDTVVYTALF